MRIEALALLSISASLLSGAALADVYKCKDAQGALLYQESPCKRSDQPVSSWSAPAQASQPDSAQDKGASVTLTIRQHPSGHYLQDGSINGKALTFVIDTGASVVSLPRSVALSAQIYCKDKILMQTANGTVSACTATIPKLGFGPFIIKDAPAMIAPNLSQPLLGMSVLQQFKIEQENGEMRISVRN